MTRDGDAITFDYSDDSERVEVISLMPFIDLLAFVASLSRTSLTSE